MKQASLQTLICTPVRLKIACLLGLPFDYQLERCTELLRVITTSQTCVSFFLDMGTYCFYRSKKREWPRPLACYEEEQKSKAMGVSGDVRELAELILRKPRRFASSRRQQDFILSLIWNESSV